ncbi:MAG TPA: hypothetical protein VNO70_25820 [Blastocatellia bacterium]|nr:hypothetical protein [Blastocatellia bacterium]
MGKSLCHLCALCVSVVEGVSNSTLALCGLAFSASLRSFPARSLMPPPALVLFYIAFFYFSSIIKSLYHRQWDTSAHICAYRWKGFYVGRFYITLRVVQWEWDSQELSL